MLTDEILNKNEKIKCLKEAGEVLKVVLFGKTQLYAVIQVSTTIREVIRSNRDRVCIDLQYYDVRYRIHVIQCYHCQEYGHMSGSPYCKQKGQGQPVFTAQANRHPKTAATKETRRLIA